MDKSTTFGDGSNDGKEGEIVNIKSWKWHGVDFVDWSDEVGFLDVEVDETSTVVCGKIFG